MLKHAGPAASATVAISSSDVAIHVQIEDDGRGAAADPPTDGSGHGVIGMRERVELYDGSFRAGPKPGGGFRVQASLPLGNPAADRTKP